MGLSGGRRLTARSSRYFFCASRRSSATIVEPYCCTCSHRNRFKQREQHTERVSWRCGEKLRENAQRKRQRKRRRHRQGGQSQSQSQRKLTAAGCPVRGLHAGRRRRRGRHAPQRRARRQTREELGSSHSTSAPVKSQAHQQQHGRTGPSVETAASHARGAVHRLRRVRWVSSQSEGLRLAARARDRRRT
jgi:hypothetical protein